MAEDGLTLNQINWRKALPFTHLFRAFRIAIHPSKLLLGFALLLIVYVGGRAFDRFWPHKYLAVPDEVVLFEQSPGTSEFIQQRDLVAAGDDTRYGLFRSFFGYQINQFSGVVSSVYHGQWFRTTDAPGVMGYVYNFLFVGPIWLIRSHTVFAIVFSILFLFSWSLFGGAIARLAAVHVAREEKISIRSALDFAIGKVLSFASAPLIPVLIVLFVGLLLALSSMVANIPILGPIALGALFFLPLLAGFVMTLVILGAIGGFNLMYPTVAVEGSDSFDAISRSFSYVYARPWRMLFYTAVSVGYGAITYMFVRFFILLMLMLAHHFVAMGIIFHSSNGGYLLPSMWPSPAMTGRLTFMSHYDQLNWAEKIGAALLSTWVYVIVGTLGAFVISFYFSANTIIYFLMRHDLDATEMDDVYLEQADEDMGHGPSSEQAVVVESISVTSVET